MRKSTRLLIPLHSSTRDPQGHHKGTIPKIGMSQKRVSLRYAPSERGHLAAKQENTTKIGMFPTVPSERGQPLLVIAANTGAEQFANILM